MRKHVLVGLTALLTILAAPAPAQAPTPIRIEEPWAPTSIGRSRIGVAYMTIVNTGAAADRLLGASSPAAAKVELHASEIQGGIARMRAMTAMELKPNEPVALKPGGLHLMLVDLKAPLAAGVQVPITLRFEKAGAVEVSVKVGRPAAAAPDAGHGHH